VKRKNRIWEIGDMKKFPPTPANTRGLEKSSVEAGVVFVLSSSLLTCLPDSQSAAHGSRPNSSVFLYIRWIQHRRVSGGR
jgi:hypothetical protein